MTDWIGPLSLLLTLSGVVTTIIAALTAAWIGKQYVSHLEEIAGAKARYESTIQAFENNEQKNQTRLTVSITGMECLFGLIMADRRKIGLSNQLKILEATNIWAGVVASPEQKSKWVASINKELQLATIEGSARQHELYILVSGGKNRSAYIRDLVESWGDFHSLTVLEAIANCKDGMWDQTEVRTAIYELRRRLRLS